jgi:hypothetical protein
VPHNIGTDCRVSIDRAARYIEAVSVFWLNYRHRDGRAAGVAAVEAHALIAARMKAAAAGLDQGLNFTTGHELDAPSARHIPSDMIGRLLDDRDLRRLQRAITRKKPSRAVSPAPDGCEAIGGRAMTLLLRKQNAQDRVEGREPFGWIPKPR